MLDFFGEGKKHKRITGGISADLVGCSFLLLANQPTPPQRNPPHDQGLY